MINFFKNKISKNETYDEKYEDTLFKKYLNCNPLKKYNLKILFITDTHGSLGFDNNLVEMLKNDTDYDCCILLGDHHPYDLQVILQYVPKEKIFGVLGNHDSWNKYEEYGIQDINGKVVLVKNVKIAGIAGSYKYKSSDEYVMYTHEESIEIAKNMENADILISHDKPFIQKQYDEAHGGLKGVTYYIYKNHISLHIHGHLHEESEEILKNGTKSICLYQIKKLEI